MAQNSTAEPGCLYHRNVYGQRLGDEIVRLDVACLIIGAGPAGLATAASLRAAGVPFLLVDRAGAPGGAYRELYDGITLASPATLDGLPGLALDSPTAYVGVPGYRAYLARRRAAPAALEGDR